MPDPNQLYKVLNADGSAYHGGRGRWHLPTRHDDGTWTPGEWMPAIKGELVPCQNGYHLARERDLLYWLGPTIWAAEYDGEMMEAEEKVVVRRARLLSQVETWNERTARLFACDCAERVLPLFERSQPNDPRPRQAIAVARRFANGEATRDELAAAWHAAWDAARAAAWDAAGAAARDAARAAARDAAEAAAEAAAWAAARDAARDAAGAAERQWQTTQLYRYLSGEL